LPAKQQPDHYQVHANAGTGDQKKTRSREIRGVEDRLSDPPAETGATGRAMRTPSAFSSIISVLDLLNRSSRDVPSRMAGFAGDGAGSAQFLQSSRGSAGPDPASLRSKGICSGKTTCVLGAKDDPSVF
jgi:hypothetical protein